MESYYVEAESNFGHICQDINASDLEELAQFVRESFAYLNGCHDTENVDCSWIEFEYILVEDCEGNDITEEANACL